MARRGGPTSTVRLVILALVMLGMGLGLGLLLSSSSCSRKGRLPGDEESAPKAPRPKPRPRTEPSVPEPPVQAPPQAPPVRGPEPPVRTPEPSRSLPRVALVIDDLGYASTELVTRLCAQPVAFSVAVLPYQEFTRESAEIAQGRGKEVMLHLPMEPVGYPGPGKNPGPDAILHDLSEAEVRARVRKALADVPHRKGVNNHMGSRITPDRTRMGWVLDEIKARHCFFVDSRTEKDSVAFTVAQELAVPTVQRKVFLDDDKAFGEMERQWDRALALARKDGQVLIIGHIYPETVQALEKLIPSARGKCRFVFASDLAR